MGVVVVYESMFGNTRQVAEAIAAGIASGDQVVLLRTADPQAALLDGADLVVVGAPTHVCRMQRLRTREGAKGYIGRPGSGLLLEPGAGEGPGL